MLSKTTFKLDEQTKTQLENKFAEFDKLFLKGYGMDKMLSNISETWRILLNGRKDKTFPISTNMWRCHLDVAMEGVHVKGYETLKLNKDGEIVVRVYDVSKEKKETVYWDSFLSWEMLYIYNQVRFYRLGCHFNYEIYEGVWNLIKKIYGKEKEQYQKEICSALSNS